MVVHETARDPSVGLLLHRSCVDGGIEVLIAHMGGPFWAGKHEHAWTIPKGLREDDDEDLLATAEREFAEEMGSPAPGGDTTDLGAVRAGRKINHVFARRADFDAATAVSNTFEMEWPRGSGRMQELPEIDEVEWVSIAEARVRLVKGLVPFLDRLEEALA